MKTIPPVNEHLQNIRDHMPEFRAFNSQWISIYWDRVHSDEYWKSPVYNSAFMVYAVLNLYRAFFMYFISQYWEYLTD
jgi:hypothetical protein